MKTEPAEAGPGPGSARVRFKPASERTFLGVGLLLFLLCAAGTVYWSGSMAGGMGMQAQNPLAAALAYLGLWLLMMAAMMLPSLLPALLRYRRSLRAAGEARTDGLAGLAGLGYFFVWGLFGIPAYLLTLIVTAAEMHWMLPSGVVSALTGAVLLLAGGYQFTGWKTRQLACCRETAVPAQTHPTAFREAWRTGLSLGGHCVLCCLGFMAVLLAAGMSSLWGMAAVAAGITLERLVPRPLVTIRLIGIVLLLAGSLAAVRALGPA